MLENKRAETLRLLRESGENVSGQDLCEHFGISRTAVWKIMNQLKEEGYEIEAVQNKGYRLLNEPDLMTKDELESRTHTKYVGQTVYYSHEVDSTNTWAKRLAEEGAPNGTLTTAETQTAGKGRRGRVWKSPEGTSVSMSLLLYPDLEPAKAPMLTIVMGLAVVQGVQRALGVDTRIKWPNDAVLNGKKLCGILTEMSAQIDYINYVVIGTGINVNQTEFPEEIAEIATSLAIEMGHPVNRAKIAQRCWRRSRRITKNSWRREISRRCRKPMRLYLQIRISRCVCWIRKSRSRVWRSASRRRVSCV